MSWADRAKERLAAGESATIVPRGNSMRPRVNDGDTVVLEPVLGLEIEAGDVVLVRVKGRDYLHLVKAVRTESQGKRYQIGNNRGGINGWVGKDAIYGRATSVTRGDKK